MKSWRDDEFKRLFRKLPKSVQDQAYDAYRLFQHDPFHPSLHFKCVDNVDPIYSVRISEQYRALGWREPSDEIVWYWIGTHNEYEKLIG